VGENGQATYTDKNGHYKIKAPAAKYFLKARAPLEGSLFSTDKFVESWMRAAHAIGKVEVHEKQTVIQDIVLQCDLAQKGKWYFVCEAKE
jgi:hypothetical protein